MSVASPTAEYSWPDRQNFAFQSSFCCTSLRSKACGVKTSNVHHNRFLMVSWKKKSIACWRTQNVRDVRFLFGGFWRHHIHRSFQFFFYYATIPVPLSKDFQSRTQQKNRVLAKNRFLLTPKIFIFKFFFFSSISYIFSFASQRSIFSKEFWLTVTLSWIFLGSCLKYFDCHKQCKIYFDLFHFNSFFFFVFLKYFWRKTRFPRIHFETQMFFFSERCHGKIQCTRQKWTWLACTKKKMLGNHCLVSGKVILFSPEYWHKKGCFFRTKLFKLTFIL